MAQPALHLDAPQRTLGATFGAYLRLTKPRVIELLLVIAVPPMFLAEGGLPPLYLMLAVVAGRRDGRRWRQHDQLLDRA